MKISATIELIGCPLTFLLISSTFVSLIRDSSSYSAKAEFIKGCIYNLQETQCGRVVLPSPSEFKEHLVITLNIKLDIFLKITPTFRLRY